MPAFYRVNCAPKKEPIYVCAYLMYPIFNGIVSRSESTQYSLFLTQNTAAFKILVVFFMI